MSYNLLYHLFFSMSYSILFNDSYLYWMLFLLLTVCNYVLKGATNNVFRLLLLLFYTLQESK